MTRRPPMRGGPLQKAIIERAQALSWRVAHFPPISTTRGTQTFWLTPVSADGKGWPDLVLVRDRIVVAEVKGDGDRLKPEQQEWIDAFLMAGVEAYIWRPRDWPDVIEQVLRRRGKPD